MSQKIFLLSPPAKSHRTAEETLSLGYLSAVLREAGHAVVVIDGWLEQLSVSDIVVRISEQGPPSVIGLSCYRSNLESAHETLQAVRQEFGDIPTICGGYGPTFHAEDFLRIGFGVAVVGEAEHVIVPLIEALLAHSDLDAIPGVAFRRGGRMIRTPPAMPCQALDALPFPSRDTITHTLYQNNYVHVSTSRGCLGHCAYCSVRSFALNGPGTSRWRQRSIGGVVDEISRLHDEHGVKHFKFVDDSFIEPPRDERWANDFRDALASRRLSIKFRTQVRSDRLTPGLVEALKGAGWFSTSLGVENAATTALRRMGKSASQEDNVAALELLSRNNIYVTMGMILFDPDTTMDELRTNLTFLNDHPWPVTKGVFTEMYAAQGTPFTSRLVRRGLVSPTNGVSTYGIREQRAQRMYTLLKRWQRSHCDLYDLVTDSLTSPKVLPDEGYESVYALYQRLRELDLRFFAEALQHVSSRRDADDDIVAESILETAMKFTSIEAEIGLLYALYGLQRATVPNPSLG